MDIIGRNTLGFAFINGIIGGYGNANAPNHYTAVAGDTVATLNWYGHSDRGINTVNIAIYQVTNDLPNARLGPVLSTSVASSATSTWYSITYATPITLNPGTTYTIAFGIQNSFWSVDLIHFLAGEDTSKDGGGGILPFIWDHISFQPGVTYPNYAEVIHTPPTSILRPCCAQIME